MSLDPSANLQIFSPPGSGRSSPSPRAARHHTEEALSKQDKGFRRYAANVERALALWDTAQQEWADYISFLQRLLKALQSHPTHPTEVPAVPHSKVVALRLAQCLNPTLPSGVHQKALEVYAHIFATIQKDALARDLTLYFPGIAPVLSFASLSVRPLFVSLLEEHILKLDSAALRPALKAIILSLLPGLEDETSEDFDRIIAALDKLRDAVRSQTDEIVDAKNETGSSHFWQCYFLAIITNGPRRQGAYAYLARRLPKFGLPNPRGPLAQGESETNTLSSEAEAAITPEPGLLIRCFEAGLSNSHLLIQRGFLDLLVSHLPLDSPVLQTRISREDLQRLVGAAAGVVSRRDMSLNRRLWAWLLGPEPPASADIEEATYALASPNLEKGSVIDAATYHAAYFSRFGLEPLTLSIMRMINRPSLLPSDRARPLRICLSLMDRGEVGGQIVPSIFLPALQSVQSYSELAPKDQVDEVLRSASIFFDGVESGLIWGKMIYLVTSAFDSRSANAPEGLRGLKLVKFILTRFNLKEEEMLVQHMPLMILSTLATLNLASDHTTDLTARGHDSLELVFEIVDFLVQAVPDRALGGDQNLKQESVSLQNIPRDAAFQKIRNFYEYNQGNLDFCDPPFTAEELGRFILSESARLFCMSVKSGSPLGPSEVPSKTLSTLIVKVRQFGCLMEFDLLSVFKRVLDESTSSHRMPPFYNLVALTTVLSALQTARPSTPYFDTTHLPELIHGLVASLWVYLDPLMPKYHVEAVRSILQLHMISASNHCVEAAISSILVQAGPQATAVANNAERGRRFAVLWTHTMHELSLQTEKRGSISRRSSGIGPLPGPSLVGSYQAIMTRPLFLLLDTLGKEGTELCAFMSSWLQNLPGLHRVFEIIVIHLQNLHCLKTNDHLAPHQSPNPLPSSKKTDDTKECLYYLSHILELLKHPSHYTWSTLAENQAPLISGRPQAVPLQEWIVCTCVQALSIETTAREPRAAHISDISRTALMIISRAYRGPFASALRELELEVPLMARLRTAGPSLQSLLLEVILLALRLRLVPPAESVGLDQKPSQQSTQRSKPSVVVDRTSVEMERQHIQPPAQLIDCFKHGFSSPISRLVLDDWVHFLTEVISLFSEAIFQNLLPLVECICNQINRTFEQLKDLFCRAENPTSAVSPESTLISLINGLEQLLAKAHDRLRVEETKHAANKSPEQPQGFFGNMVSGVFASEANQARIPTANNRLTVLLCFQDTVRICFDIWSWGGYGPKESRQDATSAASFGYTSLRMRNRARRILEHLFAVEALECLETLAVLWVDCHNDIPRATSIMGLLNVLNGSKPKHTIPAIFNAVYSRTNPNALDPNRMSTLTSDIADTDLVAFLVEYTKSLEDDAMDEIWSDCIVFLRDVLTNPLPHRQILPALLEFTAVIGQKVDNTNFGEQRKMRKELADIFVRILTAVFTTRSMGFLQDPSSTAATDKTSAVTNGTQGRKRAVDVLSTLASIVPELPTVLVDNDRVTAVVTNISQNVVGPTMRAKSFPENVSKTMLNLIYQLARVSQSNKSWKKDVSDAFNDSRFFSTTLPLLKTSWFPILAQWAQSDKDRLPELLSRLTAPTTAGIMFGVGAASARQDADRRTQFTLRRIALLILAGPEDTFTPNLSHITEKIVELLTATPASSPSSATRAEVIVLLRAVILKTSTVHLASLWPTINDELTSGLLSLTPDSDTQGSYNNAAIIQICKLLDQLVVLDPDDFQLLEWLFLCDTIDAVYKPSTTTYAPSLADEISEVLSSSTPTSYHHQHTRSLTSLSQTQQADNEPKRSLFLEPLIHALEEEEGAGVMQMARRELLERVVRPFLGHLAIGKFEAMYGGGKPDWDGVWNSVVADARGTD